MEQKSEFIKKLPYKKIVVGNGFDLHCGLKTKYKDFFEHFWKDTVSIDKIVTNNFSLNKNHDFIAKAFNGFNAWDIYFYLLSKHMSESLEWRWCDVEEAILFSLNKEENEKNK